MLVTPVESAHLNELVLAAAKAVHDRSLVLTLGEELDSGKGSDVVPRRNGLVFGFIGVHSGDNAVGLRSEGSGNVLVGGLHILQGQLVPPPQEFWLTLQCPH